MSSPAPITLALTGDVMTGRGIDQVLPHPGDPALYELVVRDAREYVELAERIGGPIPRPVDEAYVWGNALKSMLGPEIDARIVNLETSITANGDPWPGKGMHYRMRPSNIGVLKVADLDCCGLANNHVLDWGFPGLVETLRTLDTAGLAHAGAGDDSTQASSPVAIEVTGKGRVLVFAFGSTTSGIPVAWRATRRQPGINLLPDISETTAHHVTSRIQKLKRSGDVVVASIHWGDNWGYDVPDEQVVFAHRLVEGGVTIVHGHSSHHPKAIELYQDRLILYGCGDFVTDYEGIGGYEQFRPDLAVLYRVTVDPVANRVVDVNLVPFQMSRFRLHRAGTPDAVWLWDRLNRLQTSVGTRIRWKTDADLTLCWEQPGPAARPRRPTTGGRGRR
jgi:poly-gamma-glutamate synthesis protein (capsule biosynthesis protein)